MIVENINLNINYSENNLLDPKKLPDFTGYILKNDFGFGRRKTPAIIICPGGGYSRTSEREGTPISNVFLGKGFSTFILEYSCAPYVFPTSLLELFTAIKTVRENSDKWNIDPNKIFICGFSAGGHLVASAGVFWNQKVGLDLGFKNEIHKPNGLVLSYPVISFQEKYIHQGSFENLLGENNNELMRNFLSLENQVSKDTPPSFIWHTFTDKSVPVLNSIIFAEKLIENNILTELHIYPKGSHGLSLGNILVNLPENVVPKTQDWINLASEFLFSL